MSLQILFSHGHTFDDFSIHILNYKFLLLFLCFLLDQIVQVIEVLTPSFIVVASIVILNHIWIFVVCLDLEAEGVNVYLIHFINVRQVFGERADVINVIVVLPGTGLPHTLGTFGLLEKPLVCFFLH